MVLWIDVDRIVELSDQLGDETSGRLWYVRSLVHRQQGDSEAARVAMQRPEELFEQHGAQVSDILVLRSLFDRKQPEPGKDR